MDSTITIDMSAIKRELSNLEQFVSFEGIPDHLIKLFFNNLHRIISIDFTSALNAGGTVEVSGRVNFTTSLESCIAALRAGKSEFISHIASFS